MNGSIVSVSDRPVNGRNRRFKKRSWSSASSEGDDELDLASLKRRRVEPVSGLLSTLSIHDQQQLPPSSIPTSTLDPEHVIRIDTLDEASDEDEDMTKSTEDDDSQNAIEIEFPEKLAARLKAWQDERMSADHRLLLSASQQKQQQQPEMSLVLYKPLVLPGPTQEDATPATPAGSETETETITGEEMAVTPVPPSSPDMAEDVDNSMEID